jgi:hypothetical protein
VKAPHRGVFWEEKPDGLCFTIPSANHATKKTAKSAVAEADVQAALDDLKRMPLWRDYGSWYPTDVLISQSGVLVRTPVPTTPAKPGAGEPVPQRADPARR